MSTRPAPRPLTAYAAAPAPAPLRVTVYRTAGQDATRRLTEEQARLEKLYLKQFKRQCRLPIFHSSSGQPGSTVHGLTVHAQPEQAHEVEFLRKAASPSTVTAS